MKTFLSKATAWFTNIKAPDLKDKVDFGISEITNGSPLSEKYKRLFGFILFDYSMHQGPLSFLDAEEAAKEIGVLVEMEEYAKDWISHSKSKQ
jgi:hypothetical protein